ncbi:MAG: NAD(+)/NADH kinase [Ruminococcaceae bacterium]|nr:NAD(+)/NADH kinase [Oscillospiraceae bacterium]
MKVLLLPNFQKEECGSITCKVIEELAKDNVEILALSEVRAFFDDSRVRFVSSERLEKDISFAVAIGGDGTIIKSANLLLEYDIPLIGVNLGTLGFLATIEKDEIDLLHKITSGEYKLEERLTLQVSIGHKDRVKKFTAVNDIIICKNAFSGILDIDICCADIKTANYRADGIIISTASGSTAYAMSAGGPIMHPSVKAITITPICAHSLLSRPIILPEFENISVKTNANLNKKQAFVVADGINSEQITQHDEITVSRYEKNIKFICVEGKSYYSAINKKLMER